ncbi:MULTISPECIES: nucleoside triphosphate pyrophosphohydrolase [unclassified Paenibacillus]|uniref:nucleoside triphosphate pyrophosphohydrolase n=1 Tax=unclassified Paenibacillus TaxID=185978 RepID=UPI0009A6FBFC|nr:MULTISPECIES: nucleoside triphosphate pyrophosphohydrolase [unclassified Paenibacillus]SLK21897.1 tetrapyrrole methylase family protein / MazG family protein [Paenibacillus sp. RU5A]SOC76788.1 tetrapyrrole methylase family protein / MazG family protein [Paenibacillus sp. RU26A]SOC78146.1 tetrapyrrole methylase family protein / MazG family protein [Paenibacillus sp. RU5M]
MSAALTVVGLGSGDADQLTVGIIKKMKHAATLYVRTLDHPVLNDLKQEGLEMTSFDAIYETKDSFPEVYDEIADRLIEAARKGEPGTEIVYAVPGHPMVAEASVRLLKERCPEMGISLRVMGGESFLDEAFIRLGFDPIEGFQLLDASSLNTELVQPQLHTLIGQVYDVFTASDVKLCLMDVYPDDYPVFVGHALGVQGQEIIHKVPLHDLDRIEGYGNLSLIYVPKNTDDALRRRSFARLHEIVNILRSPGGCPWDQEQTHQSIRKNLIEETYEVIETIDEDDPDHMKEELGDLLLQILLHSQMEEEVGTFNVYDVIEGLNDKLIFRHPHVFGEQQAENANEALQNWEQMKAEEKKRKGQDLQQTSVLDGIPRDLPALMKGYKLQKKAAKVGFDWDDVEGVFAKIEEELAELKEAVQHNQSAEERKLELGDLLFAAANVARFIDTDPEEALAATNRKFIQRFQYIEERLREQGRTPSDSNVDEMEQYWQAAKKAGL